MAATKTRLFGEIVVAEGLCSREQIDEALIQQAALRKRGIHKTLGAVLHDLEFLSLVQVNLVLEQVDTTRRRHSIDGYEIVSRLGKGGMGAVYLARQLSLNKLVALKVLRPKLAQNKDYLGRFKREAEATAKLNHPNIVGAYDVGECNGYNYFVMEYVEGETVGEHLKRTGIIDEERAIEVMARIADALHHAWEHGIVHRDIKPANIMLSKTGEPKLCDLGLAIDCTEDQSITRSGVIMGTPYYLSPEQARSDKLDCRSDIYSLGATLYHMVTGRVLYEGETPAIVITKHLNDPVPDPLAINPVLSNGLCYVLNHMLQKRPEDRYQTPEELLEDLKELQAHGCLEGKHYAPPGRSGAIRRPRGRRGMRLVVALVLVLVAATVTIVLRHPRFVADALARVRASARRAARIFDERQRDPGAAVRRVTGLLAAEKDAERALAEAEATVDRFAGDFGRARRLFADVSSRFPGTRVARLATERLRAVNEELDERARAFFFEASAKAREHLRASRFADARHAFAGFPPSLRASVWWHHVQKELGRIERIARARFEEDRVAAAELVGDGRYAEAEQRLSPALSMGSRAIARDAEEALRGVRRARQEVEARFRSERRSEELRALRGALATAQTRYESGGVPAAATSTEVAPLAGDLSALAKTRDLALRGFQQKIGERVMIRSGGLARRGVLEAVDGDRLRLRLTVGPIVFRFRTLDPAGWITPARAGGEGRAARLLGVARLLRRDLPRAASAFHRAEGLSEDVSLYLALSARRH